jgi:hypothetical protein
MNDKEKRRATTLEEFGQLMAKMFSAERRGEPYEPRPSDVIITPFAKCGTTWLQQIFHTLRTRGDTDYDDISRVVPWIETAPRLGFDINAEQTAEPRGFKSHLGWDQIPKGARYIVSIRDPRDAVVSNFKFMEGWFFEPGSIPLEDFARQHYFNDRGYWKHLTSWWEVKDEEDVLLLCYEHMLADAAGTIGRVAEFSRIALDDELAEITLHNSSLEYMLDNKDKFDDLMMRELSERLADLPPGSDSAKVREGKVGGHKAHLSDDILDEMKTIWQEEIESRFGFSSYEEMASAL